eukprot:10716223-Ditylum_brightwellii.AAC.1
MALLETQICHFGGKCVIRMGIQLQKMLVQHLVKPHPSVLKDMVYYWHLASSVEQWTILHQPQPYSLNCI